MRVPLLSGLTFILTFFLFAGGASLANIALMITSIGVSGTQLAILIIIARGAQQDLYSADRRDFDRGLRSNTSAMEATVGSVYGVGVVSVISFTMTESLVGWFSIPIPTYFEQVGIANVVCEALSVVILWRGSIVSVYFLALCKRQFDTRLGLAQQIEINLLRPDTYQFFSMQLMRFLLLFVSFVSLCIMFGEFVASPEQYDRLIFNILGPVTLGAIAFGYFFFASILVVRNRIRSARLAELAAVRKAIAGDSSSLTTTCIANVAAEFTVPDLMTYEQKLDSMWDWPIQGNMQRFLLYVALPPLAWVMAALVERMIDGPLVSQFCLVSGSLIFCG